MFVKRECLLSLSLLFSAGITSDATFKDTANSC